jgi:hypothetical protein
MWDVPSVRCDMDAGGKRRPACRPHAAAGQAKAGSTIDGGGENYYSVPMSRAAGGAKEDRKVFAKCSQSVRKLVGGATGGTKSLS